MATNTERARQTAVATLYEQILGRNPDKGGLDYYTNSGMSVDQIAADLSKNKANDPLAGGWGNGATEKDGYTRAQADGIGGVGFWDELSSRPSMKALNDSLNQQQAAAYGSGGTAGVLAAIANANGNGGTSSGNNGGASSGDNSGMSPGGTWQDAVDWLNQAGQKQQAKTIAGTDLDPYLNPYTQNVIDTTLGTLEEQRLKTQNSNDAAAAAAGAFGGSRHGILGSETNGQFADTVSKTTALLNQDNHNSALNLAGVDAGMINNMAQFNAGQALNVGNSLLGASNQLFGMQNTANQNLANDGALQQSAMQNLINAMKGQTAGALGAPQASLGPILSALGGIPSQGGTSTTSKSPGMSDWLALLL